MTHRRLEFVFLGTNQTNPACDILCPRCVPGLLEILDFPARFWLLKQW
jgi:hypothetical protein